eukprot:Stramenopile-MAST_4_protein_3613
MNNPLSSSEQVKKQSVCEVCVCLVGGWVRACGACAESSGRRGLPRHHHRSDEPTVRAKRTDLGWLFIPLQSQSDKAVKNIGSDGLDFEEAFFSREIRNTVFAKCNCSKCHSRHEPNYAKVPTATNELYELDAPVLVHELTRANEGQAFPGGAKAFVLAVVKKPNPDDGNKLKEYLEQIRHAFAHSTSMAEAAEVLGTVKPTMVAAAQICYADCDHVFKQNIDGWVQQQWIPTFDEGATCLDALPKEWTVINELARLRRKLPPWLTIVATARRDDDVTEKLQRLNANFVVDKGLEGWQQSKHDVNDWAKKHITQPLQGVQGLPGLLTLFTDDPWTKELVLQYLETDERQLILEEPVFGKLFLYVQDRGYRLFCHKADGNFQYARHALEPPEDDVDLRMAPISLFDLRPGLTDSYAQRYEAVFHNCMEDFDVYVKPILQVLLAANGPLPADLLSCAVVGTDVNPRKHKRYLRMVMQLCRSVDDRKEAWKLTHKSYKDWFQQPEHDFSVDLVEGHLQLAHLSYKAENWVMDSPRGKYLLRHGVYHAVQCNEVVQARTHLLFQFKWLLERAKLGPPHALVQDGNRLAVFHTDRAFALLHSALRLMQPGLAKNPLQMAGQLVGRLMGYGDATVPRFHDAEIEALLATVRKWPGPDGRGWWCPFTQTYEPAGGACRMTMAGHSSPVTSVSCSPDGASIVSGSRDKTVKVWSVESGECVTTCKGHSGEVTSVSFSPDGASIVSGSWDKTVKVWSVERRVESGDSLFSGHHLDESWCAVFRNAADPPAECFDDVRTIGMSGEGTQDPRCYLSQQREGCLLVVRDGAHIHFLERRPVA